MISLYKVDLFRILRSSHSPEKPRHVTHNIPWMHLHKAVGSLQPGHKEGHLQAQQASEHTDLRLVAKVVDQIMIAPRVQGSDCLQSSGRGGAACPPLSLALPEEVWQGRLFSRVPC